MALGVMRRRSETAAVRNEKAMGAQSQVISIFSSKGGVGKTLVAANLAFSMRRSLKGRTALLELAPGHRDGALILKATDVYCVPGQATKESLASVIEGLRTSFSGVVIDAGALFTELAVRAFEHSNLILVVTTPDVVALGHAALAIERLQSVKFPLRMIKAILNRAESRGNLRTRDLQDRLPVGIIADIPSDGRLAGLSVNQGVPLAMCEGGGGRIQAAFQDLAKWLSEHPEVFVECAAADHSQLPALDADVVEAGPVPSQAAQETEEADDPVIALKRKIHSRLIESFDLKRLDLNALTLNSPARAKQLRERAEQHALELVVEEGGVTVGQDKRQQLVKEILDEALGLGPLEDLIADRAITDVLVNGKDKIYVEQRGKLSLTGKKFVSNEQLLTIIERIIAPLGRRIDESNPMVDARLPDGSRVNAIIPPLSVKGPMLSIRKFSRERYTMDDLVTFGTLSQAMAEFLAACVVGRKNIVISGGAGSGKTTLLNVLSLFIPKGERIITLEDAAELRLSQEHWVPLESRPANIEGRGAITIRQLFHNVLRMRPDRIIIGECRGAETLDMLQAMNTGHDGSLTTVHANSPQDVVTRFDSLVLMSNVDLPVRAIREQIISAVNLIVHTARMSDGARKVTHVTEITGMDDHGDTTFSDLFVFRQHGLGPHEEVLGDFVASGLRPSFLEHLRANGIAISDEIFQPPAQGGPAS